MEPENSVFRQIFEGAQEKSGFFMPDYSSDSLKTSTVPDFRNTIFWDPYVKTGSKGRTQVQFYTSDEGGTYTIVIGGITADGKRGMSMIPLKIK